jgi:hypothetical protein
MPRLTTRVRLNVARQWQARSHVNHRLVNRYRHTVASTVRLLVSADLVQPTDMLTRLARKWAEK